MSHGQIYVLFVCLTQGDWNGLILLSLLFHVRNNGRILS